MSEQLELPFPVNVPTGELDAVTELILERQLRDEVAKQNARPNRRFTPRPNRRFTRKPNCRFTRGDMAFAVILAAVAYLVVTNVYQVGLEAIEPQPRVVVETRFPFNSEPEPAPSKQPPKTIRDKIVKPAKVASIDDDLVTASIFGKGPLVYKSEPAKPVETLIYKTDPPKPAEIKVPFQSAGKSIWVPVVVNSAITMPFIVDSGATSVSVPPEVFQTLWRAGAIVKRDMIGDTEFQVADGRIVKSKEFMIRSLRVGDAVIENVKGVIGGPEPLLGQSFLTRFKSWQIDNTQSVIVFRRLWEQRT